MKRVLVVLMMFFCFSFVLASVDVHNYSVGHYFSSIENITGEINLTIVGEEYDVLITSNDDDEIKLGDFLDLNGVDFECSPPDCSKDYSSSSGVVDKAFRVPLSGSSYLGFVLDGEDVVVNSLSFMVDSNFGVGVGRPLSIEFFESEEWKFSEFSDEFLSKDWGCYDESDGSEGYSIGDFLYCEMIRISDSDSIKVGAVIGGSDTINLDMTIYPESGTGGSWTCSYDPNSEDGCVVSADVGEVFSAGKYQVCVSAENFTGYNIYEEDEGDTCGFPYVAGSANSSKDYGIYAQGVKYADASLLSSADFDYDDIIDAANELIADRYGGDCSGGCILPMEFSGVSQDARVYDVLLTFTGGFGLDSVNEVYDLDVVPVSVDFSGVLDLRPLGFDVSKTMEYIVSLGEKKLFNELISIVSAPTISSVFPLDPPAGVPIKFYAEISYANDRTLSYKWNFGDNAIETTDVPYAVHTYSGLKNYNLTLEVSAGGNLTSKRTFVVSAISPEVAVNAGLVSRRNTLNSLVAKIAGFPSWYRGALGKVVNVDFFIGELNKLDLARNESFSEDDFVGVVKDLYALDIPVVLGIDRFEKPYLVTDIDDIDIEPVAVVGGSVSGATNAVYAGPILNWQSFNIDAVSVSNKFFVSTYGDVQSDIFMVYSFDVKVKENEEAYFVINKPLSELKFKKSVGAKEVGDVTVVVLPANSDTSFEFYYEDGEPVTYFVSPKLSSIVIGENVDESCNFNLVCEKEYGENPSTCRSDCKPVFGAVVYVILSLVFVLIFYSVLQVWYKRRYEGFLFKDRRQLYNLLMYVTNARARGMERNRISAELRSQGWSSERVNYIIKKSLGKRTGLYEIIPFGKISAFFRNRRARKSVARGVRV